MKARGSAGRERKGPRNRSQAFRPRRTGNPRKCRPQTREAIRMAAASRTKQFAELHKVLKRHYKAARPDAERPVLEHLLLACCLEDAHYEAAEETFAALVHTLFDWNEVRVTSIRELTEVMGALPDPRAAAHRLKRVLQGVFEATYSFDLEDWRKKNLGPTIKWLRKIDGTTNFSVAYVVQSALGGHAIPIDSGTMWVLRLVELVSDQDVEAGVVPGLERAIPKAKGIEFGSMLHQLGADFRANPYSPAVRNILLEINPDIADRLPRRRAPKPARKRPAADQRPQAEGKPAEAAGQKGTGRGKKPPAARPKPPGPGKNAPTAKRKGASSHEKAGAGEGPADTGSKRQRSPAEGLAKRKPR